VESWVVGELNIMDIPNSGDELGYRHHFFFENHHKLLKLFTFSQTNEVSFRWKF